MAEFLGKYELRNVLGKGAMGTVYEGFDPIIARRVAIKTVRLPAADDHEAQDELARFKREAQAAGRLTHPNIVGVFDYGETPEIAYIVMEFVDGTTLKHVVDKKERFELAEIVRIMESLMAGLQYSHDRGVVHRDIKPANIMLTKAGEVKIADFGIARIESSSMTQAGTMLGTPSYMSPEQFMGQTVDARTDLYSSGVMLYQLLTGEKPFEGGLTAIMHKVLNTEPPPPSALSVTVPHSFDMVVKQAMAKRPEERFATASDFARAVRDAFEGRAAAEPGFGFSGGDGDATMVASSRPAAVKPAPATPVPPAPPPSKKPLPIGLIIGAVVVVAAIGGGAFFLLGGKTAAPAPVAASAPAPAPAPVAPPAPQLTAAQIQTAVSAALSSLSCTLFSGSFQGGKPVITGLAGAGAPQAGYTAALGALPAGVTVTDQSATFDGPYCDELNAIRPYHVLFGGTDQLGLGLQGGKTTLHDGDLVTIDQTLPSFAKYVETDYFSNDGSVLHLTPKLTAGQASLVEPLGNVSAPYGTDMIVSIAASAPIFPTPRAQDESATDYLPALRQAMQNVVSSGAQVSVAAIQVNTLPKVAQ
jgi:serine/threonine-protein kinase